MLAQFQGLYPDGCILSELIQIFQGKYIVRVSLQVEGITRVTAMAAAETVEVAEDQARDRALMLLGVSKTDVEVKTELLSQPPLNTTYSPYQSQFVSVNEDTQPKTVTTQNHDLQSKNPDYQPVSSTSVAETITKQQPALVSVPKLESKLEISSTPEPEPQTRIPEQPEIPVNNPNNPNNVTPFTPRNYAPSPETSSFSELGTRKKKSEPVNLSDVIAQTDVQIERLGWTKEQGREHLKRTYGKLGRSLLSEEELLDFLEYLKSQPDPIAGF
ncbi:MAG: hypothetical protein EAZ76_04145 [Nostocales cyanobacterium]|nr:MAG: hypothetical protein EAZ87_18305 [Nostocales cyanobacterium]TAF18911.1 MAG: hypothetical protein EAZ76_04145 [Nostocales cyanobacterium]